MKKLLVSIFALTLIIGILAGCSSGTSSSASSGSPSESVTTAETTEAQYITTEALKGDIDAGNSDLVILDVRKQADFETGHIKGAISADMDAAKSGDMANGETTMKKALTEATGSDNGSGKELVLVCYSGKAYAEAATNVLKTIGADMKKVFTLQGGMKAWDAAYPNSTVTE